MIFLFDMKYIVLISACHFKCQQFNTYKTEIATF